MKKEEFDVEKFKKSLGLDGSHREPYDYERYKELNPKLTKKMYDFCYHNGGLWKIRAGQKIIMKYENEVLEPVWWLDIPENHKNKYGIWKKD